MSQFMQTHKVYLTPISPIHIGCGEDFEPTNYVIDDGVLYHFEPSNLELNDKQKKDLTALAEKSDLLSIQAFFQKLSDIIVAQAHYFSDVSYGVENAWKEKVNKVVQREGNGAEVLARLAIERTAYQPYFNLPFIPASSLKGALMTAFLDQMHQKQNNPKVRDPKKDGKRLIKEYIGEFKNSLGRYIRFSDFQPIDNVQSKIYFAVNYKRKLDENGRPIKRVTSRREALYSGQYRTFDSELVLAKVGKELKDEFRGIPISKSEIIRVLNQFYQPIFKRELDKLIELGLVNSEWARTALSLVSSPQTALIRLGKNGSDSKVYQGKGVAQIKIQKLNKSLDHATTYWLAADNDKSTANLLPFGWALLEFDPNGDNETLKQWCDKQPKSKFDRSSILAKRAEQQAEKVRKAQEEAENALAAQQAAAEEQARLAALSTNQKIVEDFLASHQNAEVKQFTDSVVFSEAKKLINRAIEENWDKADKSYLFEKLDLESGILKAKVTGIQYSSKKGTEFKKLRNKLNAD